MNRLRGSVAVLCVTSGLATATYAEAPSGVENRENQLLTEIVVTAQKREQTLQDVPMSVSAISGDDLTKRSASTIEDMQFAVPGLAITEFSPGQQRVAMRGVSVYSGLPTVGVYMDEMPLNLELNQTGQDVRLLDMSRIEVIRGPQGTLYGQGALGGTIRYITNPVDLTHFSASVGGDFGAVSGGGNDWRTEGDLNLPISDAKAGARLAASYQHFGGWIDNPRIGESRVNSGHASAVRGKFTVKPSDELQLTLMAQHQELDLGAQNLGDDNLQVFDHLPTPFTSKVTLVSLTLTYDFSFAQLLSATGYLQRTDTNTTDLTDTFGPLLPLLGVDPATVQALAFVGTNENKIWTEELRLASKGAGAFGWTVGAFYRNSDSSGVTDTLVLPSNALPPGLSIFNSSGTRPDNSKSWAVFGEGTYAITPTLTALVGLRYFEDRRDQDSTSAFLGPPVLDQRSATFTATTPRFNLSWQPTGAVNVYVNVAEGFRSGGFNTTSVGAGLGPVPASYTPDKLWTYEIGGKFQAPARGLAAELAVYHNTWSDVQVVSNVAGLPTSFTSNGGKLAGNGVDASITYSPVKSVTLTATGGWNDMEHKSTSAEHNPGDPADYDPRFTGSASAEYRFPIGARPAFARLDYQYSDRFQVYARAFQAVPAMSDVVRMLNARFGFEADRWSASVYAKNLLNKEYVLYPAFAALVYPARIEPRVIGVSFNVKY